MDNPAPLFPDHPVLIVTGPAGSGKDTLAKMVTEYVYGTHESRLYPIRFSETLKMIAALAFGWDLSKLGDLEYKEAPVAVGSMRGGYLSNSSFRSIMHTRREVLQYLGTEVFRTMDPDVWIKAAFRELDPVAAEGFIATDCRFANEHEAITKNFRETLTVRLHLAGEEGPRTSASDHASETGIDSLPYDAEFRIKRGDMEAMRRVASWIGDSFFMDLPGQPRKD